MKLSTPSVAQSLKQQLDVLSDRAGVYLFRSSDQEILYVGKAKSLRARVRNYFRGDLADVKTEELVRRVA
jgi:excinuclease ABC subunit C